MNNSMTFSATGDSMVARQLPGEKRWFSDLAGIIQAAEARFTNLEFMVHNGDAHPGAVSGGNWMWAPPRALRPLKDYGFNLINTATNHTMDYLYKALETTAASLDEMGFVHAGSGPNLAQAAAPRYLDCPSARVALIGVCSTAPLTWIAGEQRRDHLGRPGLNLLRYETTHFVKTERIKALREIAAVTEVNARNDIEIASGFMHPREKGAISFGDLQFVESDSEGTTTKPNAVDLARVLSAVSEAKRRADYVLVSLHAHEAKGTALEESADFIISFCHACIEEGAHAVIGHGPHVLRGVEVYKQRPIFYSLANFIMHPASLASQPAEFYSFFGLGHDHNVSDVLEAQWDPRLNRPPEKSESVVTSWTMKDGALDEIRFYPIDMGYGTPSFRTGWPALSSKTEILERLKKLSEPFGTVLRIVDNVGYVRC